MATALTDEQIERLQLEYASNGSVRASARAVGVSFATASKYIDRERTNPAPPEVQAVRTQKRADIAAKMGEVIEKQLEALVDADKIAKASYHELSTSIGILTDKRLLLTGQATSRNETITTDPTARLTADEMEAAAKIRAKLAAEAS